MIKKKIKICIVGGGNVGTLLLGDLGANEKISVRLLTSKPEQWKKVVEVYSPDGKIKHKGSIDRISNFPGDVITTADIVLSLLPSHAFPGIIERIKPFIKKETWVGSMPGSGGREFFCKNHNDSVATFFGFQRVYGIARIKEYGKSVYDLGKKEKLQLATMPVFKNEVVSQVMTDVLGISCQALPNYLNVTLTPSNPILHTARLYTLFKEYKDGIYWDDVPGFYEEWTDSASKLLIACDEELQNMCVRTEGLDLRGVRSLKEHYESETPEQLTEKIRSIKAFKGIKTPMIKTSKGYIPDLSSRYFIEDFPYGLCIIKGFCEVMNVQTPSIDKILKWFEKIAHVNYYNNNCFNGADLNGLPLPQNFGINSLKRIVDYYK